MAAASAEADFGPLHGGDIKPVAVALTIVSGIILILRFWSRALIRGEERKVGPDDWMALIAWPGISAVNIIVYVWSATAGLGHHVSDLPPSFLVQAQKLLLGVEIIYPVSMTMIRISVTLLYKRVFSRAGKNFHRAFWATHVLSIAWLFHVEVLAIWQCNPPSGRWSPRDAKCLRAWSMQLEVVITNIIMDFWVLVLPLPNLWSLRMKAVKKIQVTFLFVLGYCVIFVSFGRLAAITRVGSSLSNDLSWSSVPQAYWCLAELFVAHVSISLVSVFDLCVRAMKYGLASLLTDREYPPSLPQHSDTNVKSYVSFIRPTKESGLSAAGEDV